MELIYTLRCEGNGRCPYKQAVTLANIGAKLHITLRGLIFHSWACVVQQPAQKTGALFD